MAILSMFHTIVNRKLESRSWQELYPLFFVPFYVRYGIFLCCSMWDMVFSVLFYVGYGIFCGLTSETAFSVLLYVAYGILDENVSPSKDSY
jgi:uncharacterized membrane protein YwaF